jgi:hypothetical protein
LNPVQATTPGIRRELRGYLIRYRHLAPIRVAAVVLEELEAVLSLLQSSSQDLPSGMPETERLLKFVADRLSESREVR